MQSSNRPWTSLDQYLYWITRCEKALFKLRVVNLTTIQEAGGNYDLSSFHKVFHNDWCLPQDLCPTNTRSVLMMEFERELSSPNITTTNGVSLNITKTRGFPTPESMAFKTFKLFCYSLVFLLGVIGNMLVFRMVVKRRKLRTVGNVFICNLAAADIAVLTVNLPIRLAYQENSYIWPFGAFLCKIIPMLTYLFITASSATLVLMTIDQYRAIAVPLGRRFTVKITKMVIFSIWVFSALITLPFNFALKLVEQERGLVCTDVWPSLDFERFYFFCLFVVQFIIPMTIIISCYILICNHLHSSSILDHITSTKQRNKKVRNKNVSRNCYFNVDFFLPFYHWVILYFSTVYKKMSQEFTPCRNQKALIIWN